jgi:hypothetical protein
VTRSLSCPLASTDLSSLSLLTPPYSLIHLGVTLKLGSLLPLGTQTEGHVEQVGTCLVHRLLSSLQPAVSQYTKKGSFYNKSSLELDN